MKSARTAAGVVVAGAALALLAKAAGEDFVLTRNLIALWPPFVVSVAIVLGAPSSARLGMATASALALVGATVTIWVSLTPAAQHLEWDELADALGDPAGPRAIETSRLGGDAAPLLLYLDDLEALPDGGSTTVGEVVTLALRPRPNYAIGPCWWGTDCGGEFPQVFEKYLPEPPDLPAGSALAERGETDRLIYRRYRGDLRLPPPPGSSTYLLQQPRRVPPVASD